MSLKATQIIDGVSPNNIPREIIANQLPVVLKGLVSDWPSVKKASISEQGVVDYLKPFYQGRPTIVCKLPPENNGRLFYDQSYSKLDYESYKGRIDDTLDAILAGVNVADAPGYYIASNNVDNYLPAFRAENDIVVPRCMHPEANDTVVSIWIGGQTVASCHFDTLDNIACCMAGHRRFTLFPPDQVQNLYPGPLEPTPGGQVISLVDFTNPDFDAHPRFKEALSVAQVAELEPGDALFLPAMWWHHVEGLKPLNILVNYWWSDAPRYLAPGMNAMYLAMLGIRDKPKQEREAWRHLFDYYIFNGPDVASAKLPSEAQGFLGRLDNIKARMLRGFLLNKLNR